MKISRILQGVLLLIVFAVAVVLFSSGGSDSSGEPVSSEIAP